ncbi:alkbh6 protein [Venturia nashicola]|uniref:Alkbh6 protein n=1 Tax=Venturia nashicola TaxID=86259 RepID=A0A4Z1PFC1_9PEZI|nr:alkbh6 protein [Venturia nashicola]
MADPEPTLPNIPTNLSAYRIPNLPPSFYYIKNFLTEHEEAQILQKIPSQRWTHLSKRRLQAHPSTLTQKNTLIASPLPPYLTTSPPILARLSNTRVFQDSKHGAPNHVLINEYKPGEGIMPHEDGAAYSPVVATVSLGGVVCLEVKARFGKGGAGRGGEGEVDKEKEGGEERWRILQEPRSLLVTTGEAYVALLHGIEPVERDEGLAEETVVNWELLGDDTKARIQEAGGVNERRTRVSLTYRDVLKVSKIGLGILGRR